MMHHNQNELASAFEATIEAAGASSRPTLDDLLDTDEEKNAYAYCEKHDGELQDAIHDEMQDTNSKTGKIPSSRELYYQEVSKYPLLTPEEERAVTQRVREGDEDAKTLLIQSNLRLIGFVAKRYLYYPGVDFDDMLQEGSLGLIHAVEKFDYKKGFKFSTYAFWWIRKAIVKYIAEQGYPMALTEKGHMDISAIRKAIDKFISTHEDKNPTIDDLAEMTGESPERIANLMRATAMPVSIYAPSYRNSNAQIADSIQDEQAENPALMAEQKTRYEVVCEALKHLLSKRERRIIELRFGIVDGQERRLEEIGQEFSLTRERVRQIQDKALTKLSDPSSPYAAAFKEFLSV